MSTSNFDFDFNLSSHTLKLYIDSAEDNKWQLKYIKNHQVNILYIIQ